MRLGYTEIADLLNFTAVAIPITTVDKSVDQTPDKFEPLNDEDLKNWKACKSCTAVFPTCVQFSNALALQTMRIFMMGHQLGSSY